MKNFVPDGEEKACPECGKFFVPSRSNQVYCSTRCKTNYNNRRFRESALARRSIDELTEGVNSLLWRNRELLAPLIGQKVKLAELEAAGFQRQFVTYIAGQTIFHCYDYGYEILPDGNARIFAASENSAA